MNEWIASKFLGGFVEEFASDWVEYRTLSKEYIIREIFQEYVGFY